MDPKLEFGLRLRAAMEAIGLAARPSVLLKLFNARYWGRSVTFQAASRWLRGQAIPEQDKLLVLAEILRIEPEVLRYGEGIRRSLLDRQQRWDQSAGFLERETFDAFLQLPVEQRRLIRETVLLFTKANAASEPQQPVASPEGPVSSAQVILRASGSAVTGTPRKPSVAPRKAQARGSVVTER